jgi:hypothetical protein
VLFCLGLAKAVLSFFKKEPDSLFRRGMEPRLTIHASHVRIGILHNRREQICKKIVVINKISGQN